MAEYLEVSLRVAVGAVFLVSAVGKARTRVEFRAFADSIRRLGVLPGAASAGGASVGAVRIATAVAAAILVAETVIVLALFAPVPFVVTAGFVLAALVLSTFALGIAVSRRAGARVECRCFGVRGSTLGTAHAVRNLVLAALAAPGAVLAWPGGVGGASPGPEALGGTGLAAAAGLLLAALVVFADDLAALFRTDPALTTASPPGSPPTSPPATRDDTAGGGQAPNRTPALGGTASSKVLESEGP